MTTFAHAKYGPDTTLIDDPTYNVPLLTEDVTVGTGLAFPGTDTVAIEAGGVEKARFTATLNSVVGETTLLASSSNPALKITQTGAGDAFVVEDSASPDSTPFVITASGVVVSGATTPSATAAFTLPIQSHAASQNVGYTIANWLGNAGAGNIIFAKSRGALGVHTIAQSGDGLGNIRFMGSDGTAFAEAAAIYSYVDGTPGAGDMPGRLVFAVSLDGTATPVEALRVDSSQSVTNNGAGSGTNAYGFAVPATKIGGTNNYGFYSAIPAAASRWNFYAAGTARNYMAGNLNLGSATDAGTLHIKNTGNMTFDGTSAFVAGSSGFQVLKFIDNNAYIDNFNGDLLFRVASYAEAMRIASTGSILFPKTVTAGGVTGAQTINKTSGTVNFAAAATSLVVTNSLVTANSIIIATVGTNDATMKSVAVVAAAGSFTLHANAAATAETRVNFLVFN